MKSTQVSDSWFQGVAARDIHMEQLKKAERFNGRAAMVLGVIEAQEPDDEPGQGEAAGEDKTVSESDTTTERETPRVVRKRSSSR